MIPSIVYSSRDLQTDFNIKESTVRLTVSRGREVVIRNDNLNEGLYLFKYHEEYKVYKVDATEESKKLGNPKVFNLIVLGVAAQHMDFTKEQWYEVIEKTVPQKTVELNKKAFDVGYTLK